MTKPKQNLDELRQWISKTYPSVAIMTDLQSIGNDIDDLIGRLAMLSDNSDILARLRILSENARSIEALLRADLPGLTEGEPVREV